MTPFLLQYLCDPVTKEPLELHRACVDGQGNVVSGELRGSGKSCYPIIRGIPRFALVDGLGKGAEPFGEQWNYFNFTDFKFTWLSHTVANTFGSPDVFRDQLVVDAGAGSGAQTFWILQSGAKHVIALELSSAVDGVIPRNLESSGFKNYDIVQCSIDQLPIRPGTINGIVICHNVIQHTPSVEATARALYGVVAPGGEFVFNCYRRNDQGALRWIRFHLIFRPLRAILKRLPFAARLIYARTMAFLRLVPGLGFILEKTQLCVQGDVPIARELGALVRLKRRYRATTINTFDCFGAHEYQHYKSDAEIRSLVATLQPDPTKVLNRDAYFRRPEPIGCALRIRK